MLLKFEEDYRYKFRILKLINTFQTILKNLKIGIFL